jgi:hypothetical protein
MVKAWTVKSSTGRDRYERQTVGRYERRCLPYAFELIAEKKTKSSGREITALQILQRPPHPGQDLILHRTALQVLRPAFRLEPVCSGAR